MPLSRRHIPRNRIVRMIVGILLLAGGLLGFLPVVGFWMIPLGLIVLSVDFPFVRRLRRRLEIRWAVMRGKRKERMKRREEARQKRQRENGRA